MSSDTDWVAVTISPRWNSACTIEAGLASILSAKSDSDEPAGQPDDLTVAARQRDAADRRRLHVVEFLATLLLATCGPCEPVHPGDRRRRPRYHDHATAATGTTTAAAGTAAPDRHRRRHRGNRRSTRAHRHRDRPGGSGRHRRRDGRRAHRAPAGDRPGYRGGAPPGSTGRAPPGAGRVRRGTRERRPGRPAGGRGAPGTDGAPGRGARAAAPGPTPNGLLPTRGGRGAPGTPPAGRGRGGAAPAPSA